MGQTIKRDEILSALEAALLPLDYVQAMWEGGAASFDRLDQWSDLDLQIVVDDDQVEEASRVVEQALLKLSPFAIRYELPQPTWHGHYQVFITLENASPFLMVDLVIMKISNPNRFLEPQIHGQAVVHFDKKGVTNPPPWDENAWRKKLADRLGSMIAVFDLFQPLVDKDVRRGRWLDALSFYQGMTLRPLVEALRMKYSPHHYNFHTRYIHLELPAEVVERLKALYFLPDPQHLRAAWEEAMAWFKELSAELTREFLEDA